MHTLAHAMESSCLLLRDKEDKEYGTFIQEMKYSKVNSFRR